MARWLVFQGVAVATVVFVCGFLANKSIASGASNSADVSPLNQPLLFVDQVIGKPSDDSVVRFVVTLPIQNQEALDDLDAHIYTIGDPLFHQFLSSQEFDDRFAPTQASYDELQEVVKGLGLSVEGKTEGRYILDVSGSVSQIRKVFGVQMLTFLTDDGTVYLGPDSNVIIPSDLSQLGAKPVALSQRP